MDAKDRRILMELAKHARMPVQQLARRVWVSREVATYRLKRLVKEGVISDFVTLIDVAALGFHRFEFFLQLRGISIEEERKFFSWIVAHDFLTWAGTTVGRWNVVLDIFARTQEQVKTIVGEILEQVQGHLESYVLVPVHAYESFPAKMVGGNAEVSEPMTSVHVKLDALDVRLLSLLAKNARIEYKELAPSLRMSANAVKYRIARLQREKAIRGYTIALDAEKLGYAFTNVQVWHQGLEEETLLRFLRSAGNVAYFYQHLGTENWNLDIGVVVKNSQELRAFLMLLRKEIQDVRIHDVYAIGEMIKSDHIPAGVFR